ncbi:MAG: hypothetical protein CMI16_12765 [Opitutaceae bacterium]|nr:hypothetical protein [Opitutaceae bacterium]
MAAAVPTSLTGDLLSFFLSPSAPPAAPAPPSPPEEPDPERLALLTIIDDEDVRLGTALQYPRARCFRMEYGALELPFEERCANGEFLVQGQRYLVLSEQEASARRRLAAARRRARPPAPEPSPAAPPAAPLAAPAAPPAPVLPPAEPERAPEGTGCSAHWGFKTVVAFRSAPKPKLDALLQLASDFVRVAAENANECHLVVVGGIAPMREEETTSALLALRREGLPSGVQPENVHIVPGPQEVGLLRFLDGAGELARVPPLSEAEELSALVETLRNPGLGSPAYEEELRRAFGEWNPLDGLDPLGQIEVARRRLRVAFWIKAEAMAVDVGGAYVSRLEPGLLRSIARWRARENGHVSLADERDQVRLEGAEAFVDSEDHAATAALVVDALFDFAEEVVRPLLGAAEPLLLLDAPEILHTGSEAEGIWALGLQPSPSSEPPFQRARGANAQWRDLVANPTQEKLAQWMAPAEAVPFRWLPHEKGAPPIVGVAPGTPMPFAHIHRAYRLEPEGASGALRTTTHQWSCLPDTGASAYVAAWSWCSKTKTMIAPAASLVDRSVDIEDLQDDVSCVLATLVQHTEQSGPLFASSKPFERTWGSLVGTLGPTVRGGRGGRELLRAVHWAAAEAPEVPEVLTLLPEAYVRYLFKDYDHDGASDCAGCVSGFLVLPDEDIVPLRIPWMSELEADEEAGARGARVWKLSGSRADPGVYKDATAAWKETAPGRAIESSGRHVWHTQTSSKDRLAGLYVRFTLAPGGVDMPTLDTDGRQGGKQWNVERV